MGLSRRLFTKAFKLAAVRRLEQGVSIGEAARALEVNPNVLQRWQREFRTGPGNAFPGHGKQRWAEGRIDTLQTALQKIYLQGLLADLALQLSDAAFGPALFPVARKRVTWPCPELPLPALQHVRVDLQRSRRLADGNPLLQPPHRGQLERLGEQPSRQSHDSILL